MRTNHFFKLFFVVFFSGILFYSCQEENLIQEKSAKAIKLTSTSSANAIQLLGTSSVYWTKAQNVHAFIVGNLLSTYNSYRVNLTLTSTAYEWYNTSQIYADATFVKYGDSRYTQYMNNTYSWMSNMWDGANLNGGYFAQANVDGSGASGDKYTDDNSLTGIIYLDCYDVTIGTTQTNYLNSAKACANWLMNSGQWDNTFGGGFWWNTKKQEKPTQTNGLAMQLFLRLYQITGQAYYKDWANSVKAWLETYMLDSSDGLYCWQYTHDGVRHAEKFTYDNAIMIETDLLYAQVMNNSLYTTKAQNLGIKMNSKLWNNTYRVYIFNSSDPRINPAWCGWGSQAMIKLYQADGNIAWLDYAQQNIDFINAKLQDINNYGYYQFCNLDGSARYTNMEGVDQAWMQRIQVLMSNYR